MAEQLGLNQVSRNGRHVDRDKRPGLALAKLMQRIGNQFLAGARLAEDQNGQIGLHHAGKHTVNILHCGGAPDQRHFFAGFIARLHLAGGLGFRERTPGDANKLSQIERLGQIVIGPLFRRPHRGHESILRTHQNDWQGRAHFLDARQKIEGVFIGHHDIGNHQIAVARRYPAPQRCGV